MLTLLGPNGSGKSQVIRQLKAQLRSKFIDQGHVLMLAAGRLYPLESTRMFPSLPHGNLERQPETDITLAESHKPRWHDLESAQGLLNQLDERPDLQIKVGARLRALFGRELKLGGILGKLKVEFARGESTYPSSAEASGLLQLVVVLTALYHDELAAVLIDEPGISLHPQYQAFVRREMERAAGDPAAGKKVVVCATHAPAMIGLRRPTDLSDIVFFSDIDTLPVQVNPSAGELQDRKLGAFVRSLGASHREAVFAPRPLLVEGPSDEIVVNALEDALDANLHASGGHVVQAVGKGTMPTILKLLRLIGKEPAALADLDGFTDDLVLVNAFNDVEAGRAAAGTAATLHAAVKPAHDALGNAVNTHWADIAALATAHPYWTGSTDTMAEAKRKRRAAAAVLLKADPMAVAALPNATSVWEPLRRQLSAALDLLENAGLFILRHGTVEDGYAKPADRADKVGSAAEEADQILAHPGAAMDRYDVAFRALKHVSPALPVDESAAVRNAFASVVAPVLGALRENTEATTADLQAAIRHPKDVAPLFTVERAAGHARPAVTVELSATVLNVDGFPVKIEASEDAVTVAERAIRPRT